MSCHLHGLSILVTRPAHQADALCELIETAHGRPIRFPAMEIVAAEDTGLAREQVSLLGEPGHVKVTKVNTTWYYSDRRAEGPHVVFDTRQMRVDRWRAPRSR